MDIFAFPSLQEGLPVSLMEAMASSKAIIASKIRGNIDLLGEDYEYYIEPLDYPNISKIINQVMIKLKENQFNSNLLSRLRPFDISHIHKTMHKIYSEI
jgi:glycosyltransferase involved in cell wall biosynthesis